MNRPDRESSVFRTRLRFTARGPSLDGAWNDPDTAQARYTQWVGLYGSSPTVMIQLIEETAGREHVRRTWTAGGGTRTGRD